MQLQIKQLLRQMQAGVLFSLMLAAVTAGVFFALPGQVSADPAGTCFVHEIFMVNGQQEDTQEVSGACSKVAAGSGKTFNSARCYEITKTDNNVNGVRRPTVWGDPSEVNCDKTPVNTPGTTTAACPGDLKQSKDAGGNTICVTPGAGDTAAKEKCIDSRCDLVAKYVNPLITLLAAAVGVMVTISIVIGAIQYSSSSGDPGQVSKAKTRIMNSIIALVALVFLFAFLQFLIPGGIFTK